jgi:UDP-N-acetylglucosamine diphosphorylase/glucosamine-1-phosphate N-acetyltransferase
MHPLRVCHFEDPAVADLEPIALTRPAFALLCGRTSLGDKQHRYFGAVESGSLVRPHLADSVRQGPCPLAANDSAWLCAGPAILVNSRWLPPAGRAETITAPCVALVDEEIAFVAAQPEQLADCTHDSLPDLLDRWKRELPTRRVGGRLFRFLWEIVHHNGEQLCRDFREHPAENPVGGRPASLAIVGSAEQFFLDPTALVDPLVVADTRNGPVTIDRHAVIGAFTRLEGPCSIGPHSQVHGARIRGGTTLGPHCRVGGEVEASILHGYTNKYHDGFLGHAYVGAWVNLGAGTQNSDLRNDYGPVTVTVAGRPVDTGMTKVGCFIGDHTKTGLGTLFNTGTNIGAFCNLLPSGGLLPKYFPSFTSWWNAALRENLDLESLLATARQVMTRRGCTLADAEETLYRHLSAATAMERRHVLREAERRQRRQAA